MANTLDRQITLDGYRNFVVKWTGVLDTQDIDEAPALSISDAKNNEPRLTLVGFRVDIIEYSIGNGIEVNLSWNGDNPQQIFPLSGRGKINGWNYGGYMPDMTRAGYDGDINLSTTGFANQLGASPQNFTLAVEFVKLYAS